MIYIYKIVDNTNGNIYIGSCSDKYKRKSAHKIEKDYYDNNKDKMAEYSKKCRIKHHKKILEQEKIWRDNNKDEIKRKNKSWNLRNKDKIKLRNDYIASWGGWPQLNNNLLRIDIELFT